MSKFQIAIQIVSHFKHAILGECITLWGENERGSVVSTSPLTAN